MRKNELHFDRSWTRHLLTDYTRQHRSEIGLHLTNDTFHFHLQLQLQLQVQVEVEVEVVLFFSIDRKQ